MCPSIMERTAEMSDLMLSLLYSMRRDKKQRGHDLLESRVQGHASGCSKNTHSGVITFDLKVKIKY